MASNPNATLSPQDALHLLRRSGFGAPPLKVKMFTGMTRDKAATQLLNFRASLFKPPGRSIYDRHNNWIKYMIITAHPIQEKLVLFWHDHFASSNAKVDSDVLMASQNKLLRRMCKGNFKDLVKAISIDAAMMEFLDTVQNVKEQPNENYARELQELFTLGVKDFNGNANYAQEDVVQIARGFTGLSYNYPSGTVAFDSSEHDYNVDYQATRGAKVIYKTTGGFGAGGVDYTAANGESTDTSPTAEPDAIIDAIFQHTDSDGKKTVARYIARKLFTYFAQPNTKRFSQPVSADLKAVVDELVSASSFDTTWDLGALLHAIFIDDAFYATESPPPFGASALKSVRWPADYAVSTLRLLNMRLKTSGTYVYVSGGSYSSIRGHLVNMGQLLLEPPSVFGWDWETAWISSATLLARYNFARDVTSARVTGQFGFHPEKLSAQLKTLVQTTNANPQDILDAVLDVLGLGTGSNSQFSAADQAALLNYLTDNGTNQSLDLTDYNIRNRKLNGLFALVMQSPAYQLY